MTGAAVTEEDCRQEWLPVEIRVVRQGDDWQLEIRTGYMPTHYHTPLPLMDREAKGLEDLWLR